MVLPRPISDLIEHFEKLPGIGPKTAQRLTFYLLHFPREELEGFATSLLGLKDGTHICKICKNVTDKEVCSICSDEARDKNIIAVVASSLDSFALEKTGYKGSYHILHGLINPLDGVGPDDLFIMDLIHRLDELGSAEIILATNTSMEGESTAMYISRLIRDNGFDEHKVKITRIARGLPVGGDIEYADDITLSRALEGRNAF
jgi:recombination protein RecR